MGWSCRIAAGVVLDAWSDQCMKECDSSNVFLGNGSKYFYEVGRENYDGAITGKVYKMLPPAPDGRVFAKPSGGFRIEPDGSVSRGPASLKKASKNTKCRLCREPKAVGALKSGICSSCCAAPAMTFF